MSAAPEPESTPRAITRGHAALHLIKPGQLQESLQISSQPSLRNSMLAGLQTALADLIALPLFYLSPWPHLVAYASLGAMAALFGRFATPAGRRRIVALCGFWLTASVLAMSGVSYLGAPPTLLLLLLALSCGFFFFVATSSGFGPPGALIFVFAVGASMSRADSWHAVFERAAATAAVAVLAWAICAATEAWRQRATHDRPFPAEAPRPLGHRLVAAARIVPGCGIAALLTHYAGAPHPAWAAMGALAVMQGMQLHISMNRALQRMAGTVLGACIAWAILKQSPSVWTVIACISAFQFFTELVIGYNYALGQTLVAPMALLMSYLAAGPGAAGPAMAPERVFDTIAGAAVGIVLAVLCSTVDDRIYLARHRQKKQARN